MKRYPMRRLCDSPRRFYCLLRLLAIEIAFRQGNKWTIDLSKIRIGLEMSQHEFAAWSQNPNEFAKREQWIAEIAKDKITHDTVKLSILKRERSVEVHTGQAGFHDRSSRHRGGKLTAQLGGHTNEICLRLLQSLRDKDHADVL